MKEITIYQCKVNIPYAFMNWEFAQANGFRQSDYDKVANFLMRGDSDSELLEQLWHKGNNGELREQYPMRSMSVSDIIQIDNKKYYVDSFGFAEI